MARGRARAAMCARATDRATAHASAARRSADGGAASVVAVGILGAVVVLATLSLGVVATYVDVRRAAAAADASALAAADAASGALVGTPCDLAATLAVRNGARLVSCTVDGAISSVVVAVSGRVPGVEPVASARAGPPGSDR
ncbi:Rv3654c family TadE-like protein [Agromyces sp. Marseille-Q5079]|uniref:Rv3654c family TadE-like protein n=1 Tax=Agromyces sp. Marseille-Q5079 TaxID=3439059 RepID=UPI003D9CB8BF